jgi:hypothetical protein
VITIPATATGKLFRRGFNQIGMRSLGVSPVNPSDSRPPGPLASRTGRQVWPVAVYALEIR